MVKHMRLKKLINWTIQGPIVTRLMLHFLSYNLATVFLLLVVYGIRGSLAAVSDQPWSSNTDDILAAGLTGCDLHAGDDAVHDLGLMKSDQSHRRPTLSL